MPDESTTTTADVMPNNGVPAAEPQNTEQNAEHMIPRGRFNEVNEQLKELKAKFAEIEKAEASREKAKKEAEEKRLLEEKQFEQVITEKNTKLAELEPKVTTLTESLTAYQQTVEEILTARIEVLGEGAKSAVENLPGTPDALAKLKWLNANETLFKTDDKRTPIGSPQAQRRPAGLPPAAPQQPQNNSTEYRPSINF